MAAKITPVDAMRQRPASCERSSRSIRRCGRAGEAVDQRGPGAQRAGELRAVDREAFLDRDVQVGQLPLLRRGDLAAHPRDPARQPDRRGEHDERDQREPPGQRDHRDRRGDRGGQVGRDRGRRARDDRLQAPDVVGDAGLDLAGAGLGEEGDGLALQVGEDVGAQAVHHLLPDAGARPRSARRRARRSARRRRPCRPRAWRAGAGRGSAARCRSRRGAGTARPCRARTRRR